MSRDKQIEEMAKALCKYSTTEYCASGRCQNPNCLVNAKALEIIYDKGYRKASDVAEEIFAEIEKCFFEELVGCTEAKLIDEESFAELKKKYESEKDDG